MSASDVREPVAHTSDTTNRSLLEFLILAGGINVLLYGLAFLWLSAVAPAVVEFVFTTLLLLSYVWLRRTGRGTRALVRFHIACVFVVVFLVTAFLGGFQGSGAFAIWGLIGPLAAMVFLGFRQALLTFGVWAVVVFASLILSFPTAWVTGLHASYTGWMGVANLLASSMLVLATLTYFLRRLSEEQRAREASQQAALRAQKLESLGTLAGGIAHDFNNILTAFAGNVSLAQLALQSGDPPEEALGCLGKAAKAVQQATGLTRQLLAFSKGGAPVRAPAAIGAPLREATEFILSGSNCTCHFDIDEDLWTVEADVGQLGQLVQNLVLNACQSMPEGGPIEVSLTNLNDGVRPPVLADGVSYVVIGVSDRGEGIEAGILDRIFDPYFTTRETGTGLGLTSCYIIAQNHRGHIDVQSEPGRGSTFTVYIPAAPRAESRVSVPAQDVGHSDGRVLILDDEPDIRLALSKMLGVLGHEVDEASDGREAVRLYEASLEAGTPYSCAILDLTIKGGMGGCAAAQEIVERDATAHLIASSGYTDDRVLADHASFGFADVLPKPYTLKELRDLFARMKASGDS